MTPGDDNKRSILAWVFPLCLGMLLGHTLFTVAQIRRSQAEHLERMERLDKAYETMRGIVRMLEERLPHE